MPRCSIFVVINYLYTYVIIFSNPINKICIRYFSDARFTEQEALEQIRLLCTQLQSLQDRVPPRGVAVATIATLLDSCRSSHPLTLKPPLPASAPINSAISTGQNGYALVIRTDKSTNTNSTPDELCQQTANGLTRISITDECEKFIEKVEINYQPENMILNSLVNSTSIESTFLNLKLQCMCTCSSNSSGNINVTGGVVGDDLSSSGGDDGAHIDGVQIVDKINENIVNHIKPCKHTSVSKCHGANSQNEMCQHCYCCSCCSKENSIRNVDHQPEHPLQNKNNKQHHHHHHHHPLQHNNKIMLCCDKCINKHSCNNDNTGKSNNLNPFISETTTPRTTNSNFSECIKCDGSFVNNSKRRNKCNLGNLSKNLSVDSSKEKIGFGKKDCGDIDVVGANEIIDGNNEIFKSFDKTNETYRRIGISLTESLGNEAPPTPSPTISNMSSSAAIEEKFNENKIPSLSSPNHHHHHHHHHIKRNDDRNEDDDDDGDDANIDDNKVHEKFDDANANSSLSNNSTSSSSAITTSMVDDVSGSGGGCVDCDSSTNPNTVETIASNNSNATKRNKQSDSKLVLDLNDRSKYTKEVSV